MIHEYALDPDVLAFWASSQRDYAEFMREYGVGTPRIFSSFPRQRGSKLRSYLLQRTPGTGDALQGKRFEEMVLKLAEEVVIREAGAPLEGTWPEIVRIENERLPFGAVLSSEVIQTQRNLTPANMYSPDSIWAHPRQAIINRTFLGFSSAIRDLLRLATESVVVVDAFGWTQPATVAMRHIINGVRAGRINSRIPSVVLYYKTRRAEATPAADYVKAEILRGLTGFDPSRLFVFELDELEGGEVFHNRCILTEHGGIITGHGIGVTDRETQTDEIALMEMVVYQKRWDQFLKNNCYSVVSKSA